MIVVVQIGYSKAGGRRKKGQLVRAFLNDLEVTWNDLMFEGKYVTSRADSLNGYLWYLCKLDLLDQDVLRVEVKTGVVGAGADEDRTFEALYMVNAESPVREIVMPEVGAKGYPLVKGRVIELGSVSEADRRKSELSQFLDEGF